MTIRWLGAFGVPGSLHDSLEHELAGGAVREVCAEPLVGRSYIRARVGLLVRRRCVIRSFPGDVWSERDNAGRLRKTRSPLTGDDRHREAWCRVSGAESYRGIVVHGWANLTQKRRSTIAFYARKYHLPVLGYSHRRDKMEEIQI